MNRRQFVKLSPAFSVAAVTATLTLKEDGKPPIEGLDVSVLKVQPGDYVILQCEGRVSFDAAERIRMMWEASVPGTKVLVFGEGLKVAGVLRGESAWPDKAYWRERDQQLGPATRPRGTS